MLKKILFFVLIFCLTNYSLAQDIESVNAEKLKKVQSEREEYKAAYLDVLEELEFQAKSNKNDKFKAQDEFNKLNGRISRYKKGFFASSFFAGLATSALVYKYLFDKITVFRSRKNK